MSKRYLTPILLVILGILLGCGSPEISVSPTLLPSPSVTASPTITLTPTLIPTPSVTDAAESVIPTPVYYPCRNTAKASCITKDTPAVEAIAMTIYGEGGNINLQLGMDMLQVLDNTMFNTWECWQYHNCSEEAKSINPKHRDYIDTTRDERIQLALYVLSKPYIVEVKPYPAWNCWEVPFPWQSVEDLPFERKLWNSLLNAVIRWIETSDLNIIAYWDTREFVPHPVLIANKHIMFFYGGQDELNQSLVDTASYVYNFEVGGEEYHIYYSMNGHK